MGFLDNIRANLDMLGGLGLVLPSVWFIVWATVFNVVGLIGLRRGMKLKQPVLRVTGIVLLVYPLFVGDFWTMFIAGLAGSAVTYRYWNLPASK